MDALTAFHEAGHATVSFLLGEMPEEVSIKAEGDSLGHTRYLRVEARAIAEAVLGNTKADQDRVWRFLVSTCAGPVAQSIYQRGPGASFMDETAWDIFNGGGDYRQAQLAFENARGPLNVTLSDVVSDAFNMLGDAGVWSAVEQVAGDLLRFKELDFGGVRNAILFNELIGIKPKQVSPRKDKLRRDGWSESEIGTGRRVLSREEAERKIKAKSPLGASRIAWTGMEMERR
jgi:hypothetical protein